MKKLLVVLLALILCVTTLASCDFLKNFADIRNGETGEEDKKPVFNVDAAADYVYNLYKNKNTTASDFEVTAKVNILGVVHTVEWSVDTDKVTIDVKDENTFIVNVDEESPEELAYVLTATIKGGDKTATKSFNLTVPKYVLTPFEEYIDKTEGDVGVKGIVVAINSKAAGNTRNHLFLEDLNGKGGYYSYQMDADPVADLGIKVGMIVEVSGPVSPYSGMQEIKGGSARIVDPTIHEVKTFDITDAFANGDSLKNYVGLLVTVKGVEITGQELGGTSEYLKFKLNGKEAYVRTYVTDFPTTLKADDKATIDAAHAEHFGWTANATGVLVLYSNNPYLSPVGVDCFEYLELIVKSDEEKIADVLGEIKLGTSFTGDTVVDLPVAVYPEVTLTWESNSEYVVVADGKLTITVPNEAVEAILTLTAKCGEKTEIKTFTLKLSKTAEPVKDIIDLGASMEHNTYTTEKHLVAGIITEVYNTTYGNMKITDEFGNILTIYGAYSADGANRYDAMESKPVAGDYVVILGIVGQYNGTPQVKNGWIMSFTTPTSVKDAIDTGASMEHNTYTPAKVVVKGVITEVYNTTYGNMKITDENGNILTIYGTYSSTGANRYDAMTNAPVAGDTVTIYGILGQYNGTPQIKNGWIVAVTKGSDTPECTEHVDADGDEKCDVCGADVPAVQPPVTPDPTPDTELSVKEAIDFALTQEHNVFTEGKYYVTGVITEVYNAQYGNMKITDENGNILTLYGTFSADGSIKYADMEVKPVAGDTITIYGIVGQYNGTPQVKNGWIVKHTPAGNTPDPECKHTNTVVEGAIEATCNKAGFTGNTVCVDCKEVIANGTEIPATGKHTFADGKCTVCGEADPNYTPDTPDTQWTLVTELKDGDLVLIGAPAYGKLLSTVKVATYYNKGVDYSADNFANVTDAEIFVVTVNADGSYTFTSLTGVVIALADSYSSLNETGAHKSWTLKSKDDGTFLVYNTGRKTYLEWYASKSNWSTYTAGNTAEYYLSFYVKTSSSGDTPVEPECKHTNTVVEGATEATCNTPGFTGNTVCADCKEVIANGTEIPATGKHTFADGKCTVCGAEDPDYVKPDAPVAGGSADFNTIVLPSSKPNGDSSYTNSYTTANGWVTNFSAIQCGGSTVMNPQFPVIGSDNTSKAVCLNGKTTGVGKITSPVLTGGISKLTINYTKMFTDTKLSVTVTITDANGNKYTHIIEAELSKDEKYVVYTDEWVLETPITGDFTIEIVNNCPSGSTSNKDRFTVLSIVWEGGVAETPETPDTPDTPDTPVVTEPITYVFAEYEAGEQYAANEVHKLDDMVTVTTNDAHFTKQIRLYQQAANSYGPARNGTAIFETASAIKSLSINAGEKAVPIEVYGSTNGTDWVLITTITATKTYTDYEITLGSTEYTYIKLAAVAGQARVASVTFGF